MPPLYLMSSAEVNISTKWIFIGSLTAAAVPSNLSRATSLRSGHSRAWCQVLKIVEAVVVVSFISVNSKLHFHSSQIGIPVEQVCACCHVVFPLCIPPLFASTGIH